MQLHELPPANLRHQFLGDWREAVADLRSRLRGRRGYQQLCQAPGQAARPCIGGHEGTPLRARDRLCCAGTPGGVYGIDLAQIAGYAVSVETCRGITCCKTAAEAPAAVKYIPRGKLLHNCPSGWRYLHLVRARQQLIIPIKGRYY